MVNASKILIVDDNEINRNVLNGLVLGLGRIPILAENGKDAMEIIEKQLPDLILLDILMPGMNGYEVLDLIKNTDNLRHIPVIMISAVDETDSVVRCIEKGADDYLIKPFNPTLLKARIGACLEKKILRDTEKELHEKLERNYYELVKLEQARDAMVHMIIHDLRNNVTTIMGYTQLLQSDIDKNRFDEKRIRKDLECIYKSTEEMSILINGILDVSRIEAGEMPVSYGELNLLDFASRMCDRYAPIAEKKQIRVSIDPESDSVMVYADRELLSRILQNLFANALRYAKKKIDIFVKHQNGKAILCIADDGIGIPEKYREKIFEKYFQIETVTGKRKYGIGLGLAFCKIAAEVQGGKIWVESEESKGSVFKIELSMAGITE
ncbi:MAG: hybrid sensor histidine kinase/response regulator [Candidatus Kuenenia sp.]|nr:hybrid sensor histidine kinase/response regulator [Candidatus Kuenenia hertensis]